MAWTKYKCIILYILLFNFNYFSSLPIKQLSSLEITGTIYTNYLDINSKSEEFINSNISSQANNIFFDNFTSTSSELLLSQNLRPGQSVEDYAVTITREGDHFVGRVVIAVRLTEATMEKSISFNVEDLTIQSVLVGVLTSSNAVPAVFEIDRDYGILRITPDQPATSYSVIIEYTAPLRNYGTGLHLGRFGNSEYISMNLYPTHARRVFPCMDEPSLTSDTIFTFNNMGYNNIFANTLLAVNSENTFRPLSGPNHLWGMMAHNFNNTINIPLQNVHLYIRPSVASDQESHAVVAISNYYTGLNEWTGKPYLDIIQNQDEKLRIVAIPDISRDWYALSTVCIWEPYILMDINHAVKQRKIAFLHIAEAMARQWFGYVRYPANWRHQWVLSGLASYAAYEVANQFQTNPEDNSMIDMTTIFTTEVIQESLFTDAYTGSLPLDPGENIFNEKDIRTNINGLVRVKAPAILRMLRLIIDDEKKDIVKLAAQALMSSRSLQPVSTQIFYDALKSDFDGNGLVSRVDEFLQSWVTNNGYPVVNVLSRQNRIILTQERFGLISRPNTKFIIPISFTTSLNPRFNNIYPTRLLEEGDTINISLEKDDWIVLNIQGQGYYRVNYEDVLWQSLTNALRDSKERKIIHPLNRAALIDDSLNLARAGILDYDIALNLLLTMELETEYAVWKAFVRNMDFLRKRLMGYVKDEYDERDKNIYLRMIQRTIGAVEENISFAPNSLEAESAMISLTRGLMMDHACRAGYGPCIAAAMRWFYDPNFEGVVNPGIPPEIRPAVYCTMMREGSEDDRTALLNRFDIEQSSYERLVILESLACSEDSSYIEELLSNTINPNGPYLTEERAKIFVAIASSCYKNAVLAVTFIRRNTNAVRNLYGGPEKLEEVIYALTDNLVDLSIVNHEGDTINISLEKDDWIVLNIQGQGYYRVHYEDVLWQSLTNALRDSKERKIIHPLNRAALIDDSLNLARAGILDYDIALNLLLTMELETEYAVWKAFVRNMDFLRKRLMGYVKDESDERDKNIYLRMIQRTIGAVEKNISFAPNSSEAESAMISLTRGLMMDHACRAGYGPCIAAAMRWFYDPNFEDVVNPGIPPEIRPAVYCTMMREGSEDDRTALLNRFDIEQSSYERLVILESLACSEDSSYIEELLSNTINPNGPYLTEERAKIFVAIASSCYKNAVLAVTFIRRNTNAVRNLYGGPEKLEEVIYALTDNLVDLSIVNHFDNWVSSLDSISNLQDSVEVARIVRDRARENLIWNNQYLEEVYTWIDKNDASTLSGIVSFTRITLNVLKTGIIPVWMSTSLGILHYFLSSIIKVDSMTLILFKYLYSVL